MYSQNSTHKLLLKTKFQGGLVKMQLQKEVFSEGLDVEYIYIYIFIKTIIKSKINQ